MHLADIQWNQSANYTGDPPNDTYWLLKPTETIDDRQYKNPQDYQQDLLSEKWKVR
jgi:hypothetical protein